MNGKVVESVISSGVIIEEGAEIYNSVIMKNAFVGKGAKIYNSIVAEEAKIESGAKVGHEKIVSGKDMITVVGNSDIINSNSEVKKQL